MPAPRDKSDRPGWLGYSAAIVASALLHVGLVVFVLFVMPNLLHSETAPPPTYTVKIVDNLPAGDLGTHLPKLAGHKKPPPPQQLAKAEVPKPEEPKVEAPKPPPPPPPAEDKNAVALKTIEATPTPTPPPPPVAAPTPVPTAAPTPKKIAKPHATPKPAPVKHEKERKEQVHKNKGKKEPVVVAKADTKPNVQEQLRKIREQLMKEHLKQQKENAEDEDEGDDEGDTGETAKPGESGGGPVVGSAKIEGKGYGVGPGTGSAGELQDLQFLLYYRQVQQKIKDAWIFPGGSNDLTATVDFSIGPDGNLTGVKIGQSSGDAAFDDSVVRAIRKAAPFPAPPDKYRSEFQSGVAAMFRLGELKS